MYFQEENGHFVFRNGKGGHPRFRNSGVRVASDVEIGDFSDTSRVRKAYLDMSIISIQIMIFKIKN